MPDQLALLDELLAPGGQALMAAVAEAGPIDALALGSRLRRGWPAELVAFALTQRELRQAAAAKFSRAGAMLFTRAGLEQATAEPVARHRAGRLEAVHGPVADLCCGIGGDLVALAAGRPALAADADPVHLRLAAHNAAVYGAGPVSTSLGDVRALASSGGLAGAAAVFVDPARRAGGWRLAGRSEPPLDWCLGLAGLVPAVVVKAAPGLDRAAAPPGWELELVALGRDLKEAVLWSPALAGTARRATVLPAGATMVDACAPAPAVAEPGAWLLDPNPAVTRAGLVRELAAELGAWQLDPAIAFLSTDDQVATPFARTLKVLESAPWDERRIPARLAAHGVGAVDVRRRGLAGDVDRLRRRLRLDGPLRATLVMTRLRGRPWMVLCAELDA